MEVLSVFATPIATSKLNFDLCQTLEYVKNIPFESVSDNSCEYSVSKFLLKNIFFSNIVSQINNEASLYASEVMCYDMNNPDYTIGMKTSWCIKMKPGDYADSHYHSQSLFTGILYLNVDDGGSNQLVMDYPHAMHKRFAEVPYAKTNMFNDIYHQVTPKEQDLILFPSDISHSAKRNESNKTLYCLIMDFSIKGTLSKNSPSELTFSW